MKIGLIGKSLTHSYSKQIHDSLSKNNYQLINLDEDEFIEFIKKRNFNGINITIPYKEKVIPYLDEMDETSSMVGSVNCVVNNQGRIIGYNTDVYGFEKLLEKYKIEVSGRKILVLGSGGTSKTVKHVLIKQKAKEIYIVSRIKQKGTITYEEAKTLFDINVIVNTTPYGMMPNYEDSSLVDLSYFPYLESVVDVIYNPLKTQLIIDAKIKGCKVASGLYMLVQQAIKSHELFLKKKYSDSVVNKIFNSILLKESNLVFIGMPSCGKSTASLSVSRVLNKKRYDTDEEIEKEQKMKIKDIFSKNGEEYFRKLETEKIKELSSLKGAVISIGGGTLMNNVNIKYILRNGILIFLNRDLELLKSNRYASINRPLLEDMNAFDTLYRERFPIYLKCADFVIVNNGTKLNTRNMILEKLL